MYKYHRFIALLACLILLPLGISADEILLDEEPEITIVVSAERAAQPASESVSSITVITAKEIRERGARTAADVLRAVPGLTVRQNGDPGSLATAMIRGAKASQVLILVDGQRLSSPAFIGGTDLSKLPLAEVSRIEVIRGPASSLYGSEAVGGVINIITRTPSGSGGQFVLCFGENGRSERSLSLRGGSESLSWQINGSSPTYSGTRPNSDYSGTSVSGRVTMPDVRGWNLAFRAEDYRDSLGLPGSTAYPSDTDHQWWNRTFAGLTASRDMGIGRVELNLYRSSQELKQINPEWMLDSRITGKTEAGEMTYRWQAGAHRFIAGSEIRDENYEDMMDGAVVQRKGIRNRAIFIQDRMPIGSKADVVMGLRFDDHSAAGSRLSPRIAATYGLSSDTRLRASYGQGFRAPNLVELYYNGPYGQGNPNLLPEKSRQYELGINKSLGNDVLDFAIFLNRVNDQIDWEVVDWETWAGTYRNVSRARQRGLELSWGRRFAGAGSLNMSYTYIDAKNLTDGSRLLGMPRNQITMTLAGPMGRLQGALTGRWTDGRLDYGSVNLPGRAVFDLTVTKPGGKREPYLTIRNLTNTAYEEIAGYPAEGRAFEIGMRSSW